MDTHSRKLLLASGIALAMAAINGALAADTLSQDVIEARQETQIWTTYTLNPYLRTHDLKVSVQNGKATLTGTVEEDAKKKLAKEIALGVNGVHEVDNQIVVQADYIPPKPTSARGYGEVIDDASITAAVKSILLWSTCTNGLTMHVDTQLGMVMLLGTTDSAAAKELAGHLAMNTRGVVSVDNQLVVNETKSSEIDSAKSPADEAGQGIADIWITTQVKSGFVF